MSRRSFRDSSAARREIGAALPATLSHPLEYLLVSGGDPRLHIDPIRMLNGYGCRPWPRPEAFTFASSTATSISERGFAAAAAARSRLQALAAGIGLEEACDREAERIRHRLRSLLRIGRSVEIVLSPSGTDSQLHALFVAQQVLDGPVVSIVAAADETGSGTVLALTGRHFNSVTASGVAVVKGEPVAGLRPGTECVAVTVRDVDGHVRSPEAFERALIDSVDAAIGRGKRVLLHVMDSSKLGWRCPRRECLEEIKRRWADRVAVVVDACQMRLGRNRLGDYLERQFMVLVTGSKFFTGPPFSGALLVPSAISARLARIDSLPDGLAHYSSTSDWPTVWKSVRAAHRGLPNIGQLFRWSAALAEMEAYFAVPASYRTLALTRFSTRVSEMIRARPCLELLQACPWAEGEIDDEELGTRTIFPFFVRRQGQRLPVAAASILYRALNRDISDDLGEKGPAWQRRIAAQPCHIGQPVAVADGREGVAGALRISAGARVVSETWSTAGETLSLQLLEYEFDQVATILDKIDLLVEHFDTVAAVADAQELSVLCEAHFDRLPSSSFNEPWTGHAMSAPAHPSTPPVR